MLRHAIVILRLIEKRSFKKIEAKIEVKKNIVARIMLRTIARVENENFNDVLTCVDNIDRLGRSERVSNNTQLSSNIRNAILKHSHLKSHVAVLDQENIDISSQKRLSRSLIERI